MKKNSWAFKIIFVATAMACLIGAVSIIRMFIYKEPVQYVTVSFDTDGGKEVLPVRVVMGTTLSAEPYSEKDGLIFVGWCTDAERTQPFYRNDPIDQNITLYANYVEPKSNCSFYSPDSVYIPSGNNSFSFSLRSDTRITSLNLSDYVQAEAIFGTLPSLKVTSNGNGYTVSPESNYDAGAVIRFTLCRDDVTFLDYYTNVNMLTVTISNKDTDQGELALNSGIKYLSRESLTFKNDDLNFVIPLSVADQKKIAEGSIVCLGDGKSADAPNTSFIKIDSLSRQDTICFISASECSVNDVVTALNDTIYEVISKPEYLIVNAPDISIVNDILNSDGINNITEALSAALILGERSNVESETSADTEAPGKDNLNSFSPSAEIFNEYEYVIEGLTEGLTANAVLAEATNPNFPGVDENDWVALKLTLNYDAKLQNGDTVKADIVITYYIKAILKGTFNCDSEKNLLNYTIDIYSETDMSIRASKNGVDITDQISGILSQDTDISSDEALAELVKTLKSKTDPAELLNVPLLKGTFSPINELRLFNAKFELDYSFSVNLGSFSSDSDITVLDAVEIGLSANTKTGELKAYQNPITSYSDKFYMDSYTAGYLGIRSGVNAKLSMIADAFKRLGTVGMEFETGVYTDIYGYSHIHAYREKSEDARADGAAYAEIGNYITVSTFAESEYFKDNASGSSSTGHNSIKPIFKGGNKHILVSVNNNIKNTYLSDGNVLSESRDGVYSDFNSVPLLSGNYIDITTGETLKGNFIPSELIEVRFSSRYFTYDKTTGYVKINSLLLGMYGDELSAEENTLSCEMDVYYTGSNIFPYAQKKRAEDEKTEDEEHKGIFSTSTDKKPKYSSIEEFLADPYRRREISTLVWIRPGFNYGSLGLGNTVTATFKVDTGSEVITVGERSVVVGEKVGAFDMSSIYKYYTATDGWDKDPENETITRDTVFTFKAKKKQTVVAFIYFDGEQWIGKVVAVDFGALPSAPENSESGYENMSFTGWMGTKGTNAFTPALRIYNGIRRVNSDIFAGSLFSERRGIVYGYASNEIVEMTSGTQSEVLDAIYENAVNMGAGCYIAQYASDTFPVTFIYTDDNGEKTEVTYNVKQGFDATPYAKVIENNYDRFVGWDADGDGKVDYTIGTALPAVMGEQTYTAVYSKNDVNIYTYDYQGSGIYGNKTALTAISGDKLTDILSKLTPSAPQVGTGENYEFLYWEISWDDELWFEAPNLSDLRVKEKIFIRPVFKRYITLTFDAGDGMIGGQKTITRKVAADYNIYLSMLFIETPAIDGNANYEYKFIGWRDSSNGDKFYAIGAAYSAKHSSTLVAVYERSERQYSVTVKTEHGTIYQSAKKELSFNVTYNEAETLKGIYTSNLPTELDEDNFFWRCTGVAFEENIESSSLTITYVWEKFIHLILDANGGSFVEQPLGTNGEKLEVFIPAEDAQFSFETVVPPVHQSAFLGFANENGELFRLTDTITPTQNSTFTAVWQADGETVYTVTFDAGENGRFLNGSRYFIVSGKAGDHLSRLPVEPTDETVYDNVNMKFFSAWSHAIPQTFTEDLTVSAIWDTKTTLYEIDYYIDDDILITMYLKEGESITEPEITVPDGKAFSGWSWSTVDGDTETPLAEKPSSMSTVKLIARGTFQEIPAQA